MARTTTTRRAARRQSAEQRQAERQALLDQMGEKVATLADTAEWVAYLRFLTAFRRYSFANLMLIAMQCPHATRVAGYRKWQKLGRHVREGEQAIKIRGYSTKKIATTDPDTGEEVEDRITRYPWRSVFDISQTEGEPVPEVSYQLPIGDGPAGVLPRLVGWIESQGWTVRELPLAGTMEGYTDHRRRIIATESNLSPAARLLVLLHETAHMLLHEDDAEYVAHRGVCETEAESSAYVLANLLGMDADASSISYIAGWANADPDVLAAAASNVLRAVNTIADALGLDSGDDDADGAGDIDAVGEGTSAP